MLQSSEKWMALYRAAKLYKLHKPTRYKLVKGLRQGKSHTLRRPTALPLRTPGGGEMTTLLRRWRSEISAFLQRKIWRPQKISLIKTEQ